MSLLISAVLQGHDTLSTPLESSVCFRYTIMRDSRSWQNLLESRLSGATFEEEQECSSKHHNT